MKISQSQADAQGGCQPCQQAKAPAPASGTAPPAPSVLVADATKPDWVVISLVSPDGTPVPGEAFEVHCADGAKVTGKLDTNGKVRVEGIAPGNCKVTFPDRDGREWKKK